MTEFHDLNLHDSEIIDYSIDKRNPNSTDFILKLTYIENYDELVIARKKIVFEEFYKIELKINAGIVVPESIPNGAEVEDSKIIKTLSKLFGERKIPLTNLRHYRILTNSTAICLGVVAKRFELLNN